MSDETNVTSGATVTSGAEPVTSGASVTSGAAPVTSGGSATQTLTPFNASDLTMALPDSADLKQIIDRVNAIAAAHLALADTVTANTKSIAAAGLSPEQIAAIDRIQKFFAY